VGSQARGHSPSLKIASNLDHSPLFIQEHYVNRKFHADRVDRFAGSDPETLPGLQFRVFQQSDFPLFTGIGNVRPIGQQCVLRLVAHAQFGQVTVCSVQCPLLRDPEDPRQVPFPS
jgi:hypothetical protein